MILNRTAVDWLTLTTFYAENRLKEMMVFLLEGAGKERRGASVRGYTGEQCEGGFTGDGIQEGKPHHMFRYSGDFADKVNTVTRTWAMDCNRIDLQMTVPLHVPMDSVFGHYVEYMGVLEASERDRGIKRRNVDGVLSADGFCTIYIGSRQSERFYRLYIKESERLHFIRFECEYKGKDGLAGRVWRETRKDKSLAHSILKSELDTLPDHEIVSVLKSHMEHGYAHSVKTEKRIQDPSKTLKWLRKQVSPAMMRLLGNHDTRDAAEMILMDWLHFASSLHEIDSESGVV